MSTEPTTSPTAADPQIPVGLSGLIAGVVSLHDFRRTSEMRTLAPLSAQPDYSAGATHYLFPADFATIYDLNPLFAAGTNGAGSSIAIAARSNIKLSDVEAFRSMAGLPANDPTVTLDGADPGLVAHDQDESTLDAEWSGAAAPAAKVNLVVAASTATTDGIDLAAAYIVNHAAAPVVSVSYGSCEQEMGAAELAFYNSLVGAGGEPGNERLCRLRRRRRSRLLCAHSQRRFATRSQWSLFARPTPPASAELSSTRARMLPNTGRQQTPRGMVRRSPTFPRKSGTRAHRTAAAGLWASGGGASTVYAQPAWQANVNGTGAANGMRAVPDLALAAADHDGYFVAENGSFWIASGTSAATPSFAGIMALVVQSQHGASQGNANPRLYTLAGAADDPFHTTPSGDNSVPGVSGFTATGAAYNLATGLGSVDAALLVKGWSTASQIVPPPRPIRCSRFGLLPMRCLPMPRAPIRLLGRP